MVFMLDTERILKFVPPPLVVFLQEGEVIIFISFTPFI